MAWGYDGSMTVDVNGMGEMLVAYGGGWAGRHGLCYARACARLYNGDERSLRADKRYCIPGRGRI